MNGVDLAHFPFEGDLTWMAFFKDAKGRTYARYGGREDDEPESMLSKASLLETMRRVLARHKTRDAKPFSTYEPGPGGEVEDEDQKPRSDALDTLFASYQSPEEIPTMQAMMARRENSCIHCHDVKVARLKSLRNDGALKKSMVFTYPSPASLGIHLRSDRQYEIALVDKGSAADEAGLRPHQRIIEVEGQSVLTFADFSRILELAPDEGKLHLLVESGKPVGVVSLDLTKGWRERALPWWRESTHVVGPSGGFWGQKVSLGKRRDLGLPADKMAVEVTYIWGDWTRRAGIQNGDVVVSVDGLTDDMTIRHLHAHLHLHKNWGDAVELVVRRGDKDQNLTLQLPDKPED